MKKEIIRKYFQAWLDKDIEVIKQIFSVDVVYSECYGPEYHGLNQIVKWFSDWNRTASALVWHIKNMIVQENIVVVEWYFQCDCNNVVDGFDGVSIVEFNEDDKIKSIKEFQSKAEHYYPYGGKTGGTYK